MIILVMLMLFLRPDALFRHFVVDGADQFFIIVNDVALSMDPNVMNYFFLVLINDFNINLY